jgi:hypothetical protein
MSIEMRGEAAVHIVAQPDDVYALVSDVTRMGEWSPECEGGEWIDGVDGPAIGAQFHGRNRRNGNEWTTPNTVLVAEQGREFAWVVGTQDFQVCRWRFEFAPEDGGTKVTESFELGPESVGFSSMVLEAPEEDRAVMVDARRAQLVADMEQTLAKLKERAERS